MRKMFFISLLVVMSALLAGCAAPATQASPQVNVKVETAPNPTMMGDAELVFTITGTDGKPMEGASVDVAIDHTGMSHGGMNGLASERDGGKYAIKANFSMSGTWKITLYIRKGELDVKQEMPLVVQ